MATPQPTPEEKLFAVIQGATGSSPRRKLPAISLGSLAGRLTEQVRAFDLPRVNRLLGAIAVLLVVACGLNLALQPRLDAILSQAEAQVSAFIIPAPLEGLRPLEVYVGTLAERDPFRIADAPVPGVPEGPPALPGINPQELLADFVLVGIAWGEEPTAMIEQQDTQETHVVRPGDVLGPFTVDDVLQDRVILQYGSQRIELF